MAHIVTANFRARTRGIHSGTRKFGGDGDDGDDDDDDDDDDGRGGDRGIH